VVEKTSRGGRQIEIGSGQDRSGGRRTKKQAKLVALPRNQFNLPNEFRQLGGSAVALTPTSLIGMLWRVNLSDRLRPIG
jgi:hypothetical protein